MRLTLRHAFVFSVLLPGVHGLAWACSLDLDESLIPASGDAATGDSPSFGGTGGSRWIDGAAGDGPGLDAPDSASDANQANDASDASDAPGESSAPDGVDCEQDTCAPGGLCCFGGTTGGACARTGATCASIAISCDSAADCAPGELCCAVDFANVTCQQGCPDLLQGPAQICKVDSECGANGTCGQLSVLFTALLPAGYKSCQ